MALVSLNCPNCGGSLKMEDTMEKGFCMYCGTSFLVKDEIQRVKVEHSGTVNLNLNRETEIKNLLIRAEQKTTEFRESKYFPAPYNQEEVKLLNSINVYFEKVLDLDPSNEKVESLKQSLVKERQKRETEYQKMNKGTTKEFFIILAIVLGVLVLIFLWFSL